MRVAGVIGLGMLLAAGMPLSAGDASARALMAYPMKGQSAEQENKDRSDCHDWAVEQSGYDPSGVTKKTKGSKGALTGAIIGTAIGGIVGSATVGGGKAVARGLGIGAASGGLVGGLVGSSRQKELDAKYDVYLRAGETCLEAKGYQVTR